MLNLERVGLIGCFFIPALWQGYTVEPTLFLSKLGDACENKTFPRWFVCRVTRLRFSTRTGAIQPLPSPCKLFF
jgi:hypothetical protein